MPVELITSYEDVKILYSLNDFANNVRKHLKGRLLIVNSDSAANF